MRLSKAHIFLNKFVAKFKFSDILQLKDGELLLAELEQMITKKGDENE